MANATLPDDRTTKVNPRASSKAHVKAIMKYIRFRRRIRALPQELQDRILDLVLQDDGRFGDKIKHFTRDHAIPNTSLTPTTLKITDTYTSPLALQINHKIRNTCALAYYVRTIVCLEWTELSRWLTSLPTEHVKLLKEVRLNMFPELKQSRSEAGKYCGLCFVMLQKQSVMLERRKFRMAYFDTDRGGQEMVYPVVEPDFTGTGMRH